MRVELLAGSSRGAYGSVGRTRRRTPWPRDCLRRVSPQARWNPVRHLEGWQHLSERTCSNGTGRGRLTTPCPSPSYGQKTVERQDGVASRKTPTGAQSWVTASVALMGEDSILGPRGGDPAAPPLRIATYAALTADTRVTEHATEAPGGERRNTTERLTGEPLHTRDATLPRPCTNHSRAAIWIRVEVILFS